jgi:long-chain acyl-CoA synthetase
MVQNQESNSGTVLPAHIGDVLKPWLERSPDHPALLEASGLWSYRELAYAIAETEAWLRGLGVRPGDRVMIVCENCRALVAILFATVGMDAWPVLVNARLSAREIDAIRDHCGARRVIYTTGVSPHALEHAKFHGAASAHLLDAGDISIGPLNENTSPEPIDPGSSNRVAALIYTSGTTGLPKGVMLTHRNLLFIAAASAKIRSLTPDDRIYGILPMSHAVGLSVVLIGSLLSGSALYLTPRFDPMTARTAIEKDRLTIVLGVPAMFAQILQYAKLRGLESLKFPALRIISTSGAPLHPELKLATEKLFGMVLHNGYGVTECSPTIAQTRIETPRSDTSIGSPLPGVRIQLMGPDRQPVPPNDVGELWVCGPNIMKGYYRAPEETRAVIDDEGWFNTRDLARLEDGNLFIVGRTKELIIRSGFNVYPAEIEAVLNAHPAVAVSAIIGHSTEQDEQLLAFVQLLPGASLSVAELAEYAAAHLATYKRPTQIFFITKMPVNLNGKIIKEELKKLSGDSSYPQAL